MKPAFPLLLVSLCLGCASLGIGQEEEESLTEIRSWPRTYATERDEKLVVYQPQIISWDDHDEVEARLAISFQRNALGAGKRYTKV